MMEILDNHCKHYLKAFCQDISERAVGSSGNRAATVFFEDEMVSLGWKTEMQGFDALDWRDGGATLRVEGQHFAVQLSPYSLGCNVRAQLYAVSSLEALAADISGKVLLLHGEIAQEQLMPKSFVFYNPEHHQRIIALLEEKQPVALICASARNAVSTGGLYPYPLIEDGDFDIPSVYITEEEGQRLLTAVGKTALLVAAARRIPARGFNVLARRGKGEKRIVVTAHIDAKQGTPGALDNATGVVVLLLLARLLRDYKQAPELELVALNGEDYYAVPGQMLYLATNQDNFGNILLNINIDGVGYLEGPSALASFGLPEQYEWNVQASMASFGIVEGEPWYQGDHSMFIQQSCPAIAISSSWLLEHMNEQTITHTFRDNVAVVDCSKVVQIARAVAALIVKIAADSSDEAQTSTHVHERASLLKSQGESHEA